MRFTGKRSGVLQLPQQLRVDPELGAAVRYLANVNRRSIGMQILLWIEAGIEKEQDKLCQATSGGSGIVRLSKEKSA